MAAGADGKRGSSEPTFSPRLFRFFAVWLRRYFAKRFHAVRLSRAGGIPDRDGRALVFFTNHPSWWDPILYMVLADSCFPGLQGYGPMEASALEKYGILRRLGIFPVDTGSPRAAVQFLRTAESVLQRENSSLWLTPEGAFTDVRSRPIALQGGLAHLARRLPDAVLVPVAIEYPFWDESRPEALVRFGELVQTAEHEGLDAEAWTALLASRLEQTLDALGEEAMSRDPERFRTLVGGGGGVGGVYDLWRRLVAALRGRSFRPEHGDAE